MTLDAADRARIGEVVGFIRDHDTDSAIGELLPGLSDTDRAAVAAHCRFTHAAVMVFPDSLSDLPADLRSCGLTVNGMTPSVVVRDRLARRYRRPAESLDVRILRAPVGSAEIEIFALAAGNEDIVIGERRYDDEAHVALGVADADPVVLSGLPTLLVDRGGMVPDGGGYNPHEDVTVCYFRGRGRRLEVIAGGHHPDTLVAHRPEPATQLLRLMSGAWTTQAIAVAAELMLADHLAGGAVSTERLAELTSTDHDSLRRLLRFLTSIGVLRTSGDSFALTDIGQLLRTDVHRSLHPLAVIYGGSFYESFGRLGHAVRTGEEAFQHLFGKHHFDYFAEEPERAALFDRAMASSASMFGHLTDVVDFGGAGVVVDVAGGNGELLRQVLSAAPHLKGVLLERPHAIEAARATLAGYADRCEFVAGDFTEAIPRGGDVYVLSRVLHDWDDEQCRTILKRCAEAMPRHAELLVVERLLPEDDSPALAVAWDIHMMCNVGGRERTVAHYRRLLSEAGFELTGRAELPLEVVLLRARR